MKSFTPDQARTRLIRTRLNQACAAVAFGAVFFVTTSAQAAVQPVPPCHPNLQAAQDSATVRNRGDVSHLPDRLQDALQFLAARPHSVLPLQAYAEAAQPSQLFQYYLLTTHGFETNPFTALFAGINDTAQLTATGFDCGLSSFGAVRLVVEPKPGLPTDPNDVHAFIDVFTAEEGDADSASDGFANNDRLFIPATQFGRFAVTREINDGLLAPRFAPSQRAWVLQGSLNPVRPAVPASAGRDGDDR